MDTVFRIAYGYMKNSADADDITQNVLIKLYRYDKDFESEQYLKNWLTICPRKQFTTLLLV